jgi:aryl-alcohol dehydrogenase-like predicted oxidoreductase
MGWPLDAISVEAVRMERVCLGETELVVSRLCFGTEPFAIKKGPDGMKSQGDLAAKEGGEVLRDALELGVNFWDTSDDYGTHPHVRSGLGLVDRGDTVVADKSNAVTFEEGREAVKLSLEDLNTDYVDLMLLHNVPLRTVKRRDTTGRPYESGNLQRRMEALRAFVEAKESGEVRAVGLSTHSTGVLREALEVPEVEVVCTTLNKTGMFMEDGAPEEHLAAIRSLKDAGKGVYVIKLLNAGRLRDEADSAIRFALRFHEFIDAWNIGMYDLVDVNRNLELFGEVLGS